jgi:hypothetical protein
MNLSEVQQLGRAKNAISGYFDRRLSVPKIYMDAEWDGERVDVLAIDRAGVGDAYITTLLPGLFPVGSEFDNVWEKGRDSLFQSTTASLLTRRAQFRYVAQLATSLNQKNRLDLRRAYEDSTEGFAEDGIGRVGVLLIDSSANDFEVYELVKAERFRSTKEILALTDAFVQTHTPDMEYRDPVYDQEVSA